MALPLTTPTGAHVNDASLAQTEQDVQAILDGLNNPQAWIAPTLGGGFANNGGGAQVAGYFKDANGIVHLRGVLANAAGCASGTTIFTLPAGYRPSAITMRMQFNSGAASQTGRIWIDSTGAVITQTAVGVGQQIALDDINFDTR